MGPTWDRHGSCRPGPHVCPINISIRPYRWCGAVILFLMQILLQICNHGQSIREFTTLRNFISEARQASCITCVTYCIPPTHHGMMGKWNEVRFRYIYIYIYIYMRSLKMSRCMNIVFFNVSTSYSYGVSKVSFDITTQNIIPVHWRMCVSLGLKAYELLV